MNKKKIIVVAGPTASGKTRFAIDLAKEIGGEIISADSMQVYKDMSVATAAPTKEEQSEVPHHLVEILDRDTSFSVSDFCNLAKEKIDEITNRGNIPIVCGGTGLFIDSLVDNVNFVEAKVDTNLRDELLSRDIDDLYNELKEIDPVAATQIHKNNKNRVVRALEIFHTTGKTKTQQDEESKKDCPYEALYFVLGYEDRNVLYDRINKRVDLMVENGLIGEAKTCLDNTGKTSAQAIGHKEFKPFFDGEITLGEAKDNLKKETRHYAKRQLTWFRRRENAIWLEIDKNGLLESESYAIKLSKEFLNG